MQVSIDQGNNEFNMLTNLLRESDILSKIDFETGSIGNQAVQEKRLSDLEGCFADEAVIDAKGTLERDGGRTYE